MGFLISTLRTQDIIGSDIHELCIDRVVYKSASQDQLIILYFEKEISEKCFEILTSIKKNNGKCRVSCHQFKIVEICVDNRSYSCSFLSPTTFGYVLDK